MARVLVVDDAAFMRKVVSDALTKAGHEVIAEATNGQEAVDQFQALKPDLATLDITMRMNAASSTTRTRAISGHLLEYT